MSVESAQDARAALLKELDENPAAVITTFKKGQVLDKLDADPKHRTALRTMVADAYPGTAEMMPETAVRAAVAPALEELRKEREALQAERADAAKQKNREAWHNALRAQGIQDKDLPAVEKLAQETANLDPQALALRWKAQTTPARSSAGFGRPLIPGANQDAYFKGIMDDPDGWLLDRANTLWHAVENGRDPDSIDWTKEAVA